MNVLKLNTVYTVYINLTHFYIQSHAPAPPPWHSQKKDLNFESIKLQKNPNWFAIHSILLEMNSSMLSLMKIVKHFSAGYGTKEY